METQIRGRQVAAKKMRKLLLNVGVRSQGHSCTTMRKLGVVVGVILLDLKNLQINCHQVTKEYVCRVVGTFPE